MPEESISAPPASPGGAVATSPVSPTGTGSATPGPVKVGTRFAGSPPPTVGNRVSVASQRQLVWWRFRRHKLAMVGAVVIVLFYMFAIFADFFASAPADQSHGDRVLAPPQPVHVLAGWHVSPHVNLVRTHRDPLTLETVHTVDKNASVPVRLFTHGYHYKLLGFIPCDIHLIGTADGQGPPNLFVLGTDQEGRDVYSRLLIATRTSLFIGLAGVALSVLLGVVLGGLSGYYGGWLDSVIQRVIEILWSIPTIPLWMGLAAAVPHTWSVPRTYFALTIIISLIGWTELARVVRGRFMQVRNEDFIMAAELVGARPRRIIFVHMLPLFTSHIIAATTLAVPLMIVAETSLSFLGLGLRPPAVSWGVMLQQAQNVQSVALSPWMLAPVIPVVVAILAFNFVGDGLRDAADPYHS